MLVRVTYVLVSLLFKTFYLEIIVNSQEVTKVEHSSGSPNGYISHNYSIISKQGNQHWYHVCVELCVILSNVQLYSYHHCNPDTELFYYHKDLPSSASL